MSSFNLDLQLAALKDAVAHEGPPVSVDQAISARIAAATAANARAGGRPAKRSDALRGDRWLAWPLALAASMVALSFVVRSLPPSTEAPNHVQRRPRPKMRKRGARSCRWYPWRKSSVPATRW